MRSHLRAYFKKGEQEDLRRFRVQVKKLSAFAVLADSNLEKPDLEKCFKPVKKIFRQSGGVREPFMNLEMLAANNITDAIFLADQSGKMKSAAKKLKANGGKKLKNIKDVKLKLISLVKPISDVHINIYYEHQLKHIAGLLADNKFGFELHNCRKQIKILIYNYELVKPVLNIGFNEDYMEDMQTAIGDWHDNQLTIDLLTNSKTMEKGVISNLNKKDKKLRENITSLIPDFYNRATNVMELPVEQID